MEEMVQTLEEVRRALASIRGNLAGDMHAERDAGGSPAAAKTSETFLSVFVTILRSIRQQSTGGKLGLHIRLLFAYDGYGIFAG